MGFFLYILFGLIFFGMFFMLNAKHKWLKKKDVDDDDCPPVILMFLVWPLVLAVLAAIGIYKLTQEIAKFILPEE